MARIPRIVAGAVGMALLVNYLFADSPVQTKAPEMNTPVIQQWRGDAGDYYAFDGVFYSFVNDAGQGAKLWLPPTDGPVRGVILHGNPGGGYGGDTRSKTHKRDLQEFAARHHFAIAGVTGYPGRQTYEKLGVTLLNAFKQWGEHGRHPELANLPFIVTGGSNAGVFSFGMMCLAPQQTIAITPNCGPIYGEGITDAVRKVPAWMHVGAVDPLMPTGVENTEALFREQTPHGVLWAWEAEIKGHENGSSDHVDVTYWDQIIPLRLPDKIEPGQPVKLREIDPSTGWWVDQNSWDHSITKVAPAKTPRPFDSQAGRYGWVPNEAVARIYQATATRPRLISLKPAGISALQGDATSGVYLSSGGSLIARPGDTISVSIELADMVWNIQAVDIYDQAEKLGTLDLSKGNTFSFNVDAGKRVYALYARTSDGRGVERVSNPLQVIVADPQMSAAIERQMHSVSPASLCRPAAAQNTNFDRLKRADADDAFPGITLGAARLTKDHTDAIKADGQISSIWHDGHLALKPVTINEQHAVRRGSAMPTMQVRAAYNQLGLYLLFSISDASAGVNDQSAGAVDFHIASIGRHCLTTQKSNAAIYAYAVANSLLCDALQIQIPTHPSADEHTISFNDWQPWDPVTFRTTSKQNYDGMGLWTDIVDVGNDKREIEVFIPWYLVGSPGLAGMPPAGSSIVVELGYNSDDGQTSLRWPFTRDPWLTTPHDRDTGKPVDVYGQIILLDE